MAEYIEREAAYSNFEKCNAENPKWTPIRVKSLIARQPSADVAPVRHGWWVKQDYYLCCSVCGQTISDECEECVAWFKFCQNCGARMDGDG